MIYLHVIYIYILYIYISIYYSSVFRSFPSKTGLHRDAQLRPLSCSGMRCPRQRSLQRPWSSRRTLACLDLVKQDFQTSNFFDFQSSDQDHWKHIIRSSQLSKHIISSEPLARPREVDSCIKTLIQSHAWVASVTRHQRHSTSRNVTQRHSTSLDVTRRHSTLRVFEVAWSFLKRKSQLLQALEAIWVPAVLQRAIVKGLRWKFREARVHSVLHLRISHAQSLCQWIDVRQIHRKHVVVTPNI